LHDAYFLLESLDKFNHGAGRHNHRATEKRQEAEFTPDLRLVFSASNKAPADAEKTE
jgi:hypothetical protein